MCCLPKDSYTILDIPSRISSDPDTERAVYDGFAAVMYRIDHDYLLDMQKVLHLSSPILRLITRLNARSAEYRCRLSIVNARQPLWDALLAMKVDLLIPLFPTLLDYEVEKLDPVPMAA
jgi:hypothetical protein